jgi:hypothetical protein
MWEFTCDLFDIVYSVSPDDPDLLGYKPHYCTHDCYIRGDRAAPARLTLPSTIGAHASLSFAKKLERWSVSLE